MLMRVVLYWTILSLGAIVFFTAVALLGARHLHAGVRLGRDRGGFGRAALARRGRAGCPVVRAARAGAHDGLSRGAPTPACSGGRRSWAASWSRPCLLLNNVLAFLYVKRVVLEKELYGTLALPLVFMSGLYVFWLCVLTGGIVSYAIQNVHFRNSQTAWATLTQATRERFELVVFITICRRFSTCQPPHLCLDAQHDAARADPASQRVPQPPREPRARDRAATAGRQHRGGSSLPAGQAPREDHAPRFQDARRQPSARIRWAARLA